MAEIFGIENTLDNFRIFEVVGSTTDLNASFAGNILNLTNNVRGITADGILGINTQAAATGVNGVHTVNFAASVFSVGDLEVITIDYSDLDLGQTIPFTFRYKVTSTTKATQVAALATQIQSDPRYGEMPFTVSASSSTLSVTDAPKGDLLAGEITANEILTDSVGAVVTIGGTTSRVQPFGQARQLKRIKDASGNTNHPGIAPTTRFVGAVSDTAVYTTISISYRLDTLTSNPASDAAHPLYRDVMYIDEANANFKYISTVIQNLAGAASNLDGPEIALNADTSNTVGTTIPAGAVSGAAKPTSTGQFVFLAAGNAIGTMFSFDNDSTSAMSIDASTVASQTINGANTSAVAANAKTTIRKVTATDWAVIA